MSCSRRRAGCSSRRSARKHCPPCSSPRADGGILEHSGTVEIVASENRDGTPIPNNLRWGVYVVFKAGTPLVRRFFGMHDFLRDPTGEYGAYYRPFHMIGFELGISVASAVLARRGHRLGRQLHRGCGRDRQEGPEARRHARRGGRLHGLRPPGVGAARALQDATCPWV